MFTWDSYNYLTAINNYAGQTVSLSYDANRRRWRQVYVNSGVSETTIYAGDLLQRATICSEVDWWHYIKASNQTIAVYLCKSTGTNMLRYLLEPATLPCRNQDPIEAQSHCR